LRLREVASATGLSLAHLSLVERGQTSPSVATLHALARCYGVPVAFFFQDDPGGVSVTRKGSYVALSPARGGARFELLSPDLNRRIEFLRITIDPGRATHHNFNTHPGEEVHTVLRGRVEFEIDGRAYGLEEGDSIYFFSSLPHRVRNQGSIPAVLFCAMSPPTRWAKDMLKAHGGGTPTRERGSVSTRRSKTRRPSR
jgi:mannose-6-phosphate isomerase-like protein (cupin superfamily)